MEKQISQEEALAIAESYFKSKGYFYKRKSLSARRVRKLHSDETQSGWDISAVLDEVMYPGLLEMDTGVILAVDITDAGEVIYEMPRF